MRRSVVVFAVLAALTASGSRGSDAPQSLKAGEAHRGAAFLSSSVGSDVSEGEILGFVEACKIDLIVIDFMWITHHFERSNFEKIESLSRRLTERGVVVAAMYRPRALQPKDADIHFAVRADGTVAKTHLDLCYAHEDSRSWGLTWGVDILSRCPSIRHLVLYNVRSPCHCERCRGGKTSEHVEQFLGECRQAWTKVRPDVRIGHVGLGDEHADQVDFLCPFLPVRRASTDKHVELDARVESLVRLRSEVGDKPVVPLAKICWASATKNDTADVIAAVKRCERAKLGFLLWYYDWIFHSTSDRYDRAALARALGGSPAFLAPKTEKPRAAPNGHQWMWFDSRESAAGPRLVTKTGEVLATADTVLLSYFADRAWGGHRRLSISLGDRNRVLLRFPTADVKKASPVELALTRHQSKIAVTAPFELAVHRVTGPWSEAETSWAEQPPFEEKPVATAEVEPGEGRFVVDVTRWARSGDTEHGLLLKVAKPVTTRQAVRPVERSGPWTQPPIRTGTPFSDTIPWAESLEAALERAKREKKPVLATVVPIADRRFVSGYRGAEAVWRGLKAHPWGDARRMAIDSGLVKERAMMASLFTDPEIVHLLGAHFVPVRLRLSNLAFDETSAQRYADPLPALGTTALDVGGPALVFATADGTLIHACRRMAVFSVPMVRAMLRAVLAKVDVEAAPFRHDRPKGLERAWSQARAGQHEDALRSLERLRLPDDAPWRWQALYLRAHLVDKRGEAASARELWRAVARGDPTGPWGSKAAARLTVREGRLDEWESFRTFPFDPLTEQTEIGSGDETLREVMERAVDYLLLQQRPDGGWHDPFYDVTRGSGPGSMYDKSVPRTGLVVDALLGMVKVLPGRRKELLRAASGGIDFVGRFADAPEPHTWKLTYALHLQNAVLASDLPRRVKRKARMRADRLVAALASIQHEGGWSYMPPPRIHSFNTAPILLLLTELEAHGVAIPEGMADRAAVFLEGLRLDDPRNFAYATTMRHRKTHASSCRTALCELALLRHSGGDDVARLGAGVELFFEHEALVRKTTKVFESYFAPASLHDAYHHYFGHYYTARALAGLPEADAARFARVQMDTVLAQRELDGSFVDAPMQGKSYSTAMALLTLLEDRRYVAEQR